MNLGKENEVQEFKESLAQLDKGLKSLTAMLNRNGKGTVYFGVKDNGDVKGMDMGNDTLMNIRNKISDSVEPKIVCEIRELKDENKRSYVMISATGSDIPYSHDGRYYIRNVSADERVSNELLRKMLASGSVDLITEAASEKTDLTFSGMCGELRKHGIHAMDTQGFRENYGLYNSEGKYNRMAYLLSDQNSLIVKVMRFAGVDKTVVSERAIYKDQSLLVTVSQILDYFNLMDAFRKVDLDGETRKETPLFYWQPFREAWVNACVHNSWIQLVPPSIYIYDDRIEIVSYGELPFKLTKEGFFQGKSIPVNERLFRIFIVCGHSEQSGHGIPEIVEKYGREAFSFDDGMITVTLPFNFEPDIVRIRKESEKEQAKMVLTENQKKVLEYLKQHRYAHYQNVADACEISLSGAKKIVTKLKEDGYLTRGGTKRNPEWIAR